MLELFEKDGFMDKELKKIVQAKPGEVVEVHGIPIKIASEKEMNDIAVDGEAFLICAPCSSGPPFIPNSTKALCGGCGQDVWISPATKASTPDEVLVRCIVCIQNEIRNSQ